MEKKMKTKKKTNGNAKNRMKNFEPKRRIIMQMNRFQRNTKNPRSFG